MSDVDFVIFNDSRYTGIERQDYMTIEFPKIKKISDWLEENGKSKHKWTADNLVPGSSHYPEEFMLCWNVTGVKPSGYIFDVTTNNAEVTCQECLELIHA